MKYSEIDLQCEDIMWFGVDKDGHIFECTSGGIGCVPSFVCNSRENTESLIDFFLETLDFSTNGALLIDDNDSPLVQDCRTLVKKGIYCFDVAIDDGRPNEYKKIAIPNDPLLLSDLPEDIKNLMAEHVVPVDVKSSMYIRVPHAY